MSRSMLDTQEIKLSVKDLEARMINTPNVEIVELKDNNFEDETSIFESILEDSYTEIVEEDI